MPALVRTGSGRLLKRTQSDSGIHELTQLLGQRGESSASGGAVEGITMPFVIVAEVTDGKQTVRAKLKTPEAYHLTALTSIEIMKHILDGDYKAGFQTPSKAFGADFILQFAVTLEDM
mgnify:CR=1 FL=1